MILLAAMLAVIPPTINWSDALRRDATAMHDDIAANHPGPVNKLDPGFSERNDAALATAMQRAKRVRDYAGYYYALNGYAAAFDDDHLYVSADEDALRAEWPGFLIAYDENGAQIVKDRLDDAPVPLGARLLSCDGRSADALAVANVGAFEGQWFLTASRMAAGPKLFIDFGNPFVKRPRRCTFNVGGRTRAVALNWRPIATAEAWRRIAAAHHRVRDPIASRTLADGTRWFTISSFQGNPSSAAGKALTAMVAEIKRDRAAIAAAPRVVFDLRGNGGGSSQWSNRIATILWGQAKVDAVGGSDGVDWRASPANLASMRDLRDELAKAGPLDAETRDYFERLLPGMAAAIRDGRPYWRETDASPLPSKDAAPAPLKGPVYFLTDSACASACLDAADLWSALGAIQVGRETGADTLYMDARQDTLPSGKATLSIPMKVYRGRPRGANHPLRPMHAYPGDMRDTAAIERWIATLPDNRRSAALRLPGGAPISEA